MRERQRQIVEFVQKFGIASIADLAGRYGVSEFTIRRDIDYLSQSHLVIKVKGGAKRIDTPSQFREAALTLRRQINVEQKEKIARKALEFIEPGDTIFLDGSSTIITLAQLLAKTPPHITVVTNSILIVLGVFLTRRLIVIFPSMRRSGRLNLFMSTRRFFLVRVLFAVRECSKMLC